MVAFPSDNVGGEKDLFASNEHDPMDSSFDPRFHDKFGPPRPAFTSVSFSILISHFRRGMAKAPIHGQSRDCTMDVGID